MPNPKRRHSKTRGRNRRAHWKVTAAKVSVCPQCKAPKLSHRLCPECGYYNGRPVLDFATKKAKRAEKRKKRQ